MSATSERTPGSPDMKVSVKQVFGFDSDLEVPAYATPDENVPDLDPDYLFDRQTTLAILAGFARNRRVMVTGYHGTGKSTHIEQVAARLNWPCIRINLDAHISRIDLIGRDAIVLRDGAQVTEFREGLLPWALQTPTALVFDYPTPVALAGHLGAEILAGSDLSGGAADPDEARVRDALAAVPLSRFRDAGVFDVMLRLAGLDTGTAAPADPLEADSIDLMDVDALIQTAIDTLDS